MSTSSTADTGTRVRVSMRMRLTLWNTGVFALLLMIFAVAAWITLRSVLQASGDETVREIGRAHV